MTDRPILFSAPMVRALLDGTKTQTRRVLKPQPTNVDQSGCWFGRNPQSLQNRLPFAIGDRLWVRETWQGLSFGDYVPTKYYPCDLRYFASDPCADLPTDTRGYPWRPSIFMPRWASRLTLTVTNVRVERLQDISEADAVAEGVLNGPGADGPLAEYEALWDHINGPDAWAANPWVVAISFTVGRHNIDQVPA